MMLLYVEVQFRDCANREAAALALMDRSSEVENQVVLHSFLGTCFKTAEWATIQGGLLKCRLLHPWIDWRAGIWIMGVAWDVIIFIFILLLKGFIHEIKKIIFILFLNILKLFWLLFKIKIILIFLLNLIIIRNK